MERKIGAEAPEATAERNKEQLAAVQAIAKEKADTLVLMQQNHKLLQLLQSPLQKRLGQLLLDE